MKLILEAMSVNDLQHLVNKKLINILMLISNEIIVLLQGTQKFTPFDWTEFTALVLKFMHVCMCFVAELFGDGWSK